jgi:WD40 repeat protein
MIKSRLADFSNALLLSFPLCFSLTGCAENKPPQRTDAPKTENVSESPSSAPVDKITEVPVETPPSNRSQPSVEPESEPAIASVKTKENNAKPIATPVWQEPKADLTPEQLAAWAWPDREAVELLAAKESNEVGLVTCAARTKDGNFYVLGGSKITLWSVKGTEPDKVLLQPAGNGTENYIRSMAVSPDGIFLAAGDSEGTVKIWTLDDRTELISKKVDNNDIVDLAFSPDSQSIATISFGNEISVWSTNTLDTKSKFKVSTNSVGRIGFADNDRLIVLGENTSVWKIADGKLDKELAGDRYSRVIDYSNDRQSIILGGESELRRWSITENQPVAYLSGNFANNEMVVFSPDEKNLATANGNTIRVWDLAGQKCLQVIDIVGSTVVGLEWLPASNLLMTVTESGDVRVWGTRKAGEALGLKPVHEPLTAPAIADKNPAFPLQIVEMIDLRSFPVIPGSKALTAMNSNLGYEAPVKTEEAKLFYRHHLGKRGWKESSETSANPMGIEFRKDGFMVSANFYESSPTSTNVNLNHAGNFDLRWLPRFDAAPIEESYSSEHSVSYRTKADLLTIETNLLRKMHEAGFTGYSRLNSSPNEDEDGRNLDFVKNCVNLRVSIQKFPAAPDSYTISYSRFLTDNSLPIPADSGFVEFDGSTQPYLVANTSKSLQEMTSFYDKEMKQQGWLPKSIGRSIKDDNCWLPYFQGQKDVLIGLVKLKNGKTLVRVGDELENASWQLKKSEDDEVAESENSGNLETSGLEAADFPIDSNAKEVKFNAQGKSIEFRIDGTSLADLAAKYSETMSKLGWTAEDGGVRSNEYTFFNFLKDKQEIAFRATLRQGNAFVNIAGDGLLWNKDLPGGKKTISFENWLRNNKLPTGLDLLDRYETEMKEISKSQ